MNQEFGQLRDVECEPLMLLGEFLTELKRQLIRFSLGYSD